jgi:dUTPase
MNLHIINKSNNPMPVYETEFSAGMDLRAFITENNNGEHGPQLRKIKAGDGKRQVIAQTAFQAVSAA